MIDLHDVLSYPKKQFTAPTKIDVQGLPVLHAVRDTEEGVIIGVKLKTSGKTTTRLQVFSGAQIGDGPKRLPSNQENGEIPKGRWLITSKGKQKAPSEILRILSAPKVLSVPGSGNTLARGDKKLWMSLFRDDRDAFLYGTLDDYTMEGFARRDGIRMHVGTSSLGCFTFSKVQDYRTVLKQLVKATPKHIDTSGKPVAKGAPNSLKVYGTLIVGE